MHQNKGKSIASCLADRTDYAKNPSKTNEGEYISSYECDPKTVQGEFMLSKRQYNLVTGRKQLSEVIAYQIRQSFKPGEVTPELANKIGYELGMSFTKGKHAFIVATHIDKHHIHNHIIYNSTSLDCTRKFRDFLGSGKAVRRISDRICLENGLSIIENPKKSKGHYGKWLGDEKPLSHSDKLRQIIDEVLAQKPNTFDVFLQLMKQAGYEIKLGKHTAFKSAKKKRFIRLTSLDYGYSQEFIRGIIDGKEVKKPTTKREKPQRAVNLLIDIQQKLDEGKSGGYEYWAKIHNVKQTAKTINFLREHNLSSYAELEQKVSTASANFNQLSTTIKADEKQLAEIKVLKTHIFNYRKTKDVYAEYRKSGYSKKFYQEHERELLIHKAAKKSFDELGVKKLPTIKALDIEFDEVLTRKKKAYSSYKDAREEIRDYMTAKQNIDSILGHGTEKKEKEKSQDER